MMKIKQLSEHPRKVVNEETRRSSCKIKYSSRRDFKKLFEPRGYPGCTSHSPPATSRLSRAITNLRQQIHFAAQVVWICIWQLAKMLQINMWECRI